jgi:hypothetical protein
MVKLIIDKNRLDHNKAAMDKVHQGGLHPAAKPKAKANACRQWAKMGKCSRGTSCPWVDTHTPDNAPAPKRPKSPKGKGGGKGEPKPQQPRGRTPDRGNKGGGKGEPQKRGTSPSGQKDKPPCRNYIKGTCTKGADCDYWHPPVCRFWKAGTCSDKKCPFLHMEKPQKAAPAPAKDAEAKSKAKAKAKAVVALLPYATVSTQPCGHAANVTPTSRKVKFAKKEYRNAHRHEKYPSYLRYYPYTPPTPVTEFKYTSEENRYYESWNRDQAYRLHKEIAGKNMVSEEEFFVSKGTTLLGGGGILKTTKFAAKANKNTRISTREFIVDSGASFHLVSEDSLTPEEEATKVELDHPIEVQTANGDVNITHKCRVYVFELDLWIWAHLLESTIAVLSLGALCLVHEFRYAWEAGHDPILSKGNIEVRCRPRNNVPFIFAVEGNLDPALSEEDAMIEDILAEVDPPPTPEEGWEVVRKGRRGRSRG